MKSNVSFHRAMDTAQISLTSVLLTDVTNSNQNEKIVIIRMIEKDYSHVEK